MRNNTRVKTDKEVVAEDRWTDKHELLFLAKEMVLLVSLQKQLLASE